jgi:hypothetical protein
MENRPRNLPGHPQIFYENSGWSGWGDYLGTGFGQRTALMKELLEHRDELTPADLLQIIRTSGVIDPLKTVFPNKSLSEILDAIQDEKLQQQIEDATNNPDKRTDYTLAPEAGDYVNNTNKISAPGLRLIDRFAHILNEETIERLIESQLSGLRNKYINEGRAAVEAILQPASAGASQ